MHITQNKNKFIKLLFAIALPVMIQHFISSTLNFADNIMVTSIHEEAVVATGISNQLFYIFMVVIGGLSSATTILVSQFYGKKDNDNILRTVKTSMYSAVTLGILFYFIISNLKLPIIHLFTDDNLVISETIKYLSIMSASFLLVPITSVLASAARAKTNTKTPTIASVIALLTNTMLNYLLIFGNYGFPKLEIEGAAIATVMARIIELLILIILLNKSSSGLHVFNIFKSKASSLLINKILKLGSPLIVANGVWVIGSTYHIAVYTKLGTETATAIHITNTIQNMLMIIFIGLGVASSVLIGRSIGANKNSEAISISSNTITLTIFSGLILGILLLMSYPIILNAYNINILTRKYTEQILIVTSILITLRMFNHILFSGIITGGGDAKFSMILNLIMTPLVSIPTIYIAAFIFKLPIHLIVALTSIEEIIKAYIAYSRFKSNKWIHNLVHEH
ncbi:MAG: MATE family efflux transporter [Clostridia bacterium]|jgi:putative MATE family efflux protein|nr:MATE family efflux transporter [Clostridia bacterium]